jgi:hypothetical protein
MGVRQLNYGVNQPLPLFTYKYFFKKSRPTIELLRKQGVIFFFKMEGEIPKSRPSSCLHNGDES